MAADIVKSLRRSVGIKKQLQAATSKKFKKFLKVLNSNQSSSSDEEVFKWTRSQFLDLEFKTNQVNVECCKFAAFIIISHHLLY